MSNSLSSIAWPAAEVIPAGDYRFAMEKGAVVDLTNGAVFVAKTTGDMDFLQTEFRIHDFRLRGALWLKQKFADRPIIAGSSSNPSMMIMAGDWDIGFRDKGMSDQGLNSRLVRYIIQMIAFMNKTRWSRRYCLWSNDGLGAEGLRGKKPVTFTMPSDDEMIHICESV